MRPLLPSVNAPGYGLRDYFRWRQARFRASLARVGLVGPFAGQRILDIGAGYGGSSAALAELGAHVVTSDLRFDRLTTGRALWPGAPRACLAAEALPFGAAAFDGAALFDVLEHVRDPQRALAEAARTVRRGGWLFVEFTPFYSLAGHHLYDYTFLPMQFLPRGWTHRYVRWLAGRRAVDPTGALRIFDGLNRLSIRAFQCMRRRLGLTLVREVHTLRTPWAEVDARFCRRLGPLRELLVTAYACQLRVE